jgi:acetyl-CoA carboxylase beta subunit
MLRISCTFEVHRLLLEPVVVVVLLEGLAVIAAIAALTALAEPAALVALLGPRFPIEVQLVVFLVV